MDATREDASGTPLLVGRNVATTINMEPDQTPTQADNDNTLTRSSFQKKKLSLSRNVSLSPITLPPAIQTQRSVTSQSRNSHLFTSQANSPLRQFSLNQNMGSTDLQQALRTSIGIRIYLPHLFTPEGDDNSSTCLKFKVSSLQSAEDILVMIAESLGIEVGDASEAFALWMVSPLLELQLKPHHQPCELHKSWSKLLEKFAADASAQELQADEPILYFKRKVQLSHERELQLAANSKILDLLFTDAKCNLFADRYYMTPSDAAVLAGIGFAHDDDSKNMTAEFVRKNLECQLPDHLADSIRGPMMFGKTLSSGRELDTVLSTWMENATKDKEELKRLFLAKLHSSCNQYGSAFFHGFIERPSISPLKNLKRFFQNVATGDADMAVTIGINRDTLTVIDSEKHELILMVRISDCVWKKLTWDGASPPPDDLEGQADSQPMLLLHFPEYDAKGRDKEPRTNVLQIFGYQTILIHSMLCNMHELLRKENSSEPNSASSTSSSENGRVVNRTPSLTKCDRMCLATFVNGKCVKASGSLKKVMQNMQAVH